MRTEVSHPWTCTFCGRPQKKRDDDCVCRSYPGSDEITKALVRQFRLIETPENRQYLWSLLQGVSNWHRKELRNSLMDMPGVDDRRDDSGKHEDEMAVDYDEITYGD